MVPPAPEIPTGHPKAGKNSPLHNPSLMKQAGTTPFKGTPHSAALEGRWEYQSEFAGLGHGAIAIKSQGMKNTVRLQSYRAGRRGTLPRPRPYVHPAQA